jgi:hypothetical protein
MAPICRALRIGRARAYCESKRRPARYARAEDRVVTARSRYGDPHARHVGRPSRARAGQSRLRDDTQAEAHPPRPVACRLAAAAQCSDRLLEWRVRAGGLGPRPPRPRGARPRGGAKGSHRAGHPAAHTAGGGHALWYCPAIGQVDNNGYIVHMVYKRTLTVGIATRGAVEQRTRTGAGARSIDLTSSRPLPQRGSSHGQQDVHRGESESTRRSGGNQAARARASTSSRRLRSCAPIARSRSKKSC